MQNKTQGFNTGAFQRDEAGRCCTGTFRLYENHGYEAVSFSISQSLSSYGYICRIYLA